MTNMQASHSMAKFEEGLDKFLEFSPTSASLGHADASHATSIRVFFAPGRVNLIGEHTDYNGGYVLPAALEFGTWLFVRPRSDGILRFGSSSFPQVVEVSSKHVTYIQEDDYANYPKGVIREFQKRGFEVPGFDFFYFGNLPNGAGLSSSASVEVTTAWMLNEILGAKLSREEIALVAQAAENQFVGVNCGIMDQFSVALGRTNHAISLKCDTLEHKLVPINLEGIRMIIANTNKRRGLTDSKYNERRAECEQALHQTQAFFPQIRSLGDIKEQDWETVASCIENSTIRKRAHHVVFENARAKQAVAVLRNGDTEGFGQLMNASHRSLRDDYEVTGKELDTLVEAAWSVEGCVGSRMTGAGFGGCTVSFVREESADSFMEVVTQRYTEQVGYKPSFYVSRIGEGVREVTKEVIG